MPHDTEERCKIGRKINLLFQKWQEVGEFWSEHSKVSKVCTLIRPLRTKYITFDLKKYRGVTFHDNEESCKIWRKTDMWRCSLKYKKISKKAVKLGSFLQYSVHIFLGHDGYVWKINLRILWKHQCDSITFTENIFFWRL